MVNYKYPQFSKNNNKIKWSKYQSQIQVSIKLMTSSIAYHSPNATSNVWDGALGDTLRKFIVFSLTVQPIGHYRPRGSTISPSTVRHPAPTSVKNTMQIARIENNSQTGLVASNGYLVKRANRQDQFSNHFKIFSCKMC